MQEIGIENDELDERFLNKFRVSLSDDAEVGGYSDFGKTLELRENAQKSY